MRKQAFPVAVVISALLILTGNVSFVDVASAEFSETVTIEADGSISPSTAPIAKTGNVYTMTGNISASVTIRRGDVVFDGDGYTIQSPSGSWALKLSPPTPVEPALNNITVRNVKVMEDPNASGWAWGILMESSTNSVITNCTISNIRDSLGIWVQGTGNLIVGNNFMDIEHNAIYVCDRNNTIVGNNITACSTAIDFFSTSNNTIFGNHIADNHIGIHCFSQNPLPPGLQNLIYCNNFVNNNLTLLNEAVIIGDTGVLLVPAIVNIWDNGTVGNYWSDYNGTDANGDGVGDTAYFIDDHYPLEGANDTDHYPLMNPVNITSAAASAFPSSPSPEPTPAASATPTPSTSSPSPNPSASEPTASPSPSTSPTPSPAVPELTLLAAALALTAVTCMALFIFKRKGHPVLSNNLLHKNRHYRGVKS